VVSCRIYKLSLKGQSKKQTAVGVRTTCNSGKYLFWYILCQSHLLKVSILHYSIYYPSALDVKFSLDCAVKSFQDKLNCNPYINKQFLVKCRVDLPRLPSEYHVSLEWHYSYNFNNYSERTNYSNYTDNILNSGADSRNTSEHIQVHYRAINSAYIETVITRDVLF